LPQSRTRWARALVLRGGREFGWTQEGRAALAAAEALEEKVAEVARTIRAAKQDVSGAVRVSCPSGLTEVLARRMPGICEKYPTLALELIGDNRTVDLAKGEADIALRMFRPVETDLVARRSVEMGWGAYASSAYVAEQGLPATVAELSLHRLVLYVEALHRVDGPRWIEDRRCPASQFIRVDNTQVASHVIATGGGIGVIPCFIAHGRSELVCVFPTPVASNTAWIVYHEAARDSARVRAAVEALSAFFEAEASLFTGLPL
jgi:DNA-binding transcriptional LysR family regulator